jgi:hypothetical protein
MLTGDAVTRRPRNDGAFVTGIGRFFASARRSKALAGSAGRPAQMVVLRREGGHRALSALSPGFDNRGSPGCDARAIL